MNEWINECKLVATSIVFHTQIVPKRLAIEALPRILLGSSRWFPKPLRLKHPPRSQSLGATSAFNLVQPTYQTKDTLLAATDAHRFFLIEALDPSVYSSWLLVVLYQTYFLIVFMFT